MRFYVKPDNPVPFLAIVFAAVALLLSAFVACLLFQQSMARQYQTIQAQAKELAADFEHEIKLQENDIESLHAVAQSALQGHALHSIDPLDYLSPITHPHGYALKLPLGYTAYQIGNITGLGKIPAPSSLVAKQMRMAMALSPLFDSLTQRNPDMPWVYYISNADFVYLYPRVSESEYFYEASLKQKPFFVGATPAKNPSRKAFWTPFYEDAGGKGLMVTISKPVYLDNQFLGILSIDIGIKTIAKMLSQRTVSNASIELINANKHFLLHNKTLLTGAHTQHKGDFVSEYALQSLDWKIVVRTQEQPLMMNALKESAKYGGIVLLMIMSLILIKMLITSLRKVRELSVRDFLTGLYNRRYFDEVANLEFDRAKRAGTYLVIAIIDIDHFKKYNDSYGHHAGDRTLQMIATSLSSALTRASDKLFRVGGEEFALIATLQHPDQLSLLMTRLCHNIRDLGILHKDSPWGVVTASIGATIVCTDRFSSWNESYQCADRALYRAKELGRNRVEVDLPNEHTQNELF